MVQSYCTEKIDVKSIHCDRSAASSFIRNILTMHYLLPRRPLITQLVPAILFLHDTFAIVGVCLRVTSSVR